MMPAGEIVELRNDRRELKKALSALMRAVESFGEARYMDDDDDMNKYGRKVEDAMRKADRLLAAIRARKSKALP